uniref:NAD-dependent epimerase/dehydratase domain-containing protein n=1 Tax=Rhizochromulina marina TaxID=1034831 RepID=A0A7S2R994_9STRA
MWSMKVPGVRGVGGGLGRSLVGLLVFGWFLVPGVGFRALVAGASGFLGSELCHQLADQGHQVLALVRDPEALEPGTVPAGARVLGCDIARQPEMVSSIFQSERPDVVFNTAAVFTKNYEDPVAEVVEPTVAIARHIFEACVAAGSVQRLVHTSSMAAVRAASQPPAHADWYTAEDWNTEARGDAAWPEPYQFAKLASERKLLQLAAAQALEDHPVEVVSLCPSMIFGPPRCLPAVERAVSVQVVRQWLSGKRKVESRLVCDVRDVADAHIRAAIADLPWRNGAFRFILSAETRSPASEVRACLEEALSAVPDARDEAAARGGVPVLQVDEAFAPAIPIGTKEVDASPASKLLGASCRSPLDTISDMAKTLLCV